MRALERLDLGDDLRVARLQRLAVRGRAGSRRSSTSAITSSSSIAARSPSGSGSTPPSANARSTMRIASLVAQRAEELRAEPFARLRARAAARGARARSRSGTTFFDSDIAASRSRRSSGTVAIADRGLVLARRRQAGERAEQAVRSGAGEADEPEVFHRLRRLSTTLHPHRARQRRGRMSKKTKKRKLRARRNKANHGKKPRAGR